MTDLDLEGIYRSVTLGQELDNERGLLGAMLLNPSQIGAVLDRVTNTDFLDLTNGTLFTALASIHHRGGKVNVATVSEESARWDGPDRTEILRIQAESPSSHSVLDLAQIVAERAALRRAQQRGDDLIAAARALDLDSTVHLARTAEDFVAMPAMAVEPGVEISIASEDDPELDWLVPGVMHRQDRFIVTGDRGAGKTTFMRQFGIHLACGRHPFTKVQIPRATVLHVNLELTPGQQSAEYQKLLPLTRGEYEPRMFRKDRPSGLNLIEPADRRWLEGLIEHHRPDLVLFGPLYKAVRATGRIPKHSEEAAEITARCLDDLRVKFDVAWLIEAHAGHEDKHRVRGSSLWLDWPEAGLALMSESSERVSLKPWRLFRDRQVGPNWPELFAVNGPGWPFEACELRGL